MKKKVLVAGGTGFLGFHLLKKLKNFNYTLYSLSSKKPKKNRKLPGVKYIICNVVNRIQLKKKLKYNFSYVINFSGYVDHSNKVKTMNSHYNGCKNLLDVFRNKKIRNFIQIGSSLEYGNSRSPHKESNFCKPKGNYGLAKLRATKYLQKEAKKFNISFTILRLYQVYGPNQTVNRLVPIVINSCLGNKKFSCTSGKQKRDFLYVEDLIKLIIKVIRKKPKNKIYNVGAGNRLKVKKVINLINKMTGAGEPLFGKIKMRKDEMNNNFPNISKIKKEYDWSPKFNIRSGIRNTISFYEKKF